MSSPSATHEVHLPLLSLTEMTTDADVRRDVILSVRSFDSRRGSASYRDLAPGVDWQKAALDKLRQLAVLPPDWDTQGASPPSARTLLFAECFTRLLFAANLRPRSISPSVEEGVAFNFRAPSKYAAVEFLNDGSVGLVFSEAGRQPAVECIESEESRLRAAIDQLRDFLS